MLLEPDAAFAEVQKLAAEQGESLAVTPTTLHKRLHEQRYLKTVDAGRKTLTVRKTVEGGRRRAVLILDMAKIETDQQAASTESDKGTYGGQVPENLPDQPDQRGQVFDAFTESQPVASGDDASGSGNTENPNGQQNLPNWSGSPAIGQVENDDLTTTSHSQQSTSNELGRLGRSSEAYIGGREMNNKNGEETFIF